MEKTTKIRVPKQKRSMEKKEQIKKATFALMCENGYHNITTNQIAKEAKLSIGSLYEYYPNKDAILSEIVTDYFEEFLNHEEAISSLIINGMKQSDHHTWIVSLIEQQVAAHRESIDYNRELHALYYSVSIVKTVSTEQKKKLRGIIRQSLEEINDELTVTDLDAASFVFTDILEAAIDRVVFCPPDFDETRYITEVADALCRYLFH